MKLLLHSSAGKRYHQSAIDFVNVAKTASLLVYMHLETYYSLSFNATTASKTSLFLASLPLLLCLLLLQLLLPVLLLILLLILQVPRPRLLRKCYVPGFVSIWEDVPNDLESNYHVSYNRTIPYTVR
jgi:hypothetical protein